MHYRELALALSLLGGAVQPSMAEVSIGIGISAPGVRIGINVPAYPNLVAVPGAPVYYAPSVAANYFFYDGLYWVYAGDSWYASTWYNGPWSVVGPEVVPVYVLLVPVRYYRVPPPYFRPWHAAAPPHWGEHWGPRWVARRPHWHRPPPHVAPRAPLPVYQRRYAGRDYPDVRVQQTIRVTNYHYESHDHDVRVVRERVDRAERGAHAQRDADRGPKAPAAQRDTPPKPPPDTPAKAKPKPAQDREPPARAPAAREPQRDAEANAGAAKVERPPSRQAAKPPPAPPSRQAAKPPTAPPGRAANDDGNAPAQAKDKDRSKDKNRRDSPA